VAPCFGAIRSLKKNPVLAKGRIGFKTVRQAMYVIRESAADIDRHCPIHIIIHG